MKETERNLVKTLLKEMGVKGNDAEIEDAFDCFAQKYYDLHRDEIAEFDYNEAEEKFQQLSELLEIVDMSLLLVPEAISPKDKKDLLETILVKHLLEKGIELARKEAN